MKESQGKDLLIEGVRDLVFLELLMSTEILVNALVNVLLLIVIIIIATYVL